MALGVLKRFSPRALGSIGRVAVVTVISQAISALSVLAISRNGLKASDLYALGLQVGTGAFSGYVLGVVYLLALGRPAFRSWKLHTALAAIASLILFVATFALYAGRSQQNLMDLRPALVVFASFGLGGAVLSAGGVRAVRHACTGNPLLLASNTIAPNAVMAITAISLYYTKLDLTLRLVIPALSWLAAAILSTARIMRTSPPQQQEVKPTALQGEAPDNRILLHGMSLSVGVITSTLLPIAYGAAISGLKHGILTTLFLGTRLGSAAVNVGINSLLMVRYNWNSSARFSLRLPIGLMVAVVLSSIAALFVPRIPLGTSREALLQYLPVTFAWIAGIVAAPILMRQVNALRLVNHVTMKVAADLLLSCCAAAILFYRPSISGFFAAFTLSQCTTAGVCGAALHSRPLQIISAAAGLFTLPLLIWGY